MSAFAFSFVTFDGHRCAFHPRAGSISLSLSISFQKKRLSQICSCVLCKLAEQVHRRIIGYEFDGFAL